MKLVHLQRPQRGWTLIEAIVAVTVAGMLCAAAGPELASVIEAVSRDAIASESLSALRQARSEAIKRNDQVVLCKASTTGTCTTAGGWDQGWIAFHDANGNAQLDGDEAVVLRKDALPKGWRLRGNTPLAHYVAYQSFGHTRLLSGGFQAGTFTLCKESAKPTTAVRLVINSVGRPRTETVRVASC